MFGLNHHLERFDQLDFADFLNDPCENPEMDKEGTRARLEQQFGLC